MYKADTKAWEKLPPLTLARYNHSILYLKSSLYVIGGETDAEAYLDFVEKFDFQLLNWFQVADLPTPLVKPYVAVANEHLYVFGGEEYDYCLDQVYVYDEHHNQWERKSDMPEIGQEGSCAALNSRIYTINNKSKKCWQYDSEVDEWMAVTAPQHRAALVIHGHLTVINSGLYDAEEFDSFDGKWSTSKFVPYCNPAVENMRYSDNDDVNDDDYWNCREEIVAAFSMLP
jgi:hypothetical protein